MERHGNRIKPRRIACFGASVFAALFALLAMSQTPAVAQPQAGEASPRTANTRFAVIGDYGSASQPEADVANLVRSWNPDLVITTGDNNYPLGAQSTIDQNIGQYYYDFIYPYTGNYTHSATINRFFPSLGNHDWYTGGAGPYLNYFTLPGNERYYELTRGWVQFLAIDSGSNEPDGISNTSAQAAWLWSRLAGSCATWKIVYLHHAPYSSGAVHGSTPIMQWPYAAWGATAVLAGHDHTYERIIQNGIPYFVNGLGGSSIYTFTLPLVSGSAAHYNSDYGAMLIDATGTSITFQFIARTGTVIDTYTVNVTTPSFCQTYFPLIMR